MDGHGVCRDITAVWRNRWCSPDIDVVSANANTRNSSSAITNGIALRFIAFFGLDSDDIGVVFMEQMLHQSTKKRGGSGMMEETSLGELSIYDIALWSSFLLVHTVTSR